MFNKKSSSLKNNFNDRLLKLKKVFNKKKVKIGIAIVVGLILIGGFAVFAIDGPNEYLETEGVAENTEEVDSQQDGDEEELEAEGDEEESGGSEESSSSSSAGSSSSSNSSNSGTSSTTTSSSGSSSSNQSSSSSSKTETATVYISCGTLVEIIDSLSSSVQAVVPSSGVIMGTTTVTIESGDTVYDITAKACAAKGVSMAASSGYVRGFAGIYEKDAGAMSGWKFSYNGSFGSLGSNQITVSDGDKISWGYTITGSSAY